MVCKVVMLSDSGNNELYTFIWTHVFLKCYFKGYSMSEQKGGRERRDRDCPIADSLFKKASVARPGLG